MNNGKAVMNRAEGITRPSAERIEEIRKVALEKTFSTYAWWVPQLELLAEIDALRAEREVLLDTVSRLNAFDVPTELFKERMRVRELEVERARAHALLQRGYFGRALDMLGAKREVE